MDLASLQPSHSLNVPAGHQPSSADPLPSILPCRQSTSGLPGKAIGQRSCLVDRSVDSDSSESDSEYFDAGQDVDSSDDDYFDALEGTALPAVPEQEIEQTTGDGPWQIVTRRKSRRKRQHSPVAPSGNGAARGGVQVRHVSASHSASNRVTGKNQRKRVSGSDRLSLLSSHSYWSLCVRSFARFGTVDWVSFHACQVKFHRCLQTSITEAEFLRFHHMMTKGPQAIRRADDILFLVDPLKVMLSDYELSSVAVFLSLIFEGIAPGFLKRVGERFISALSGVDRQDGELLTATIEMLAQIGQDGEHWLHRLGWYGLTLRTKCSLFSSIAFLFKHGKKLDQIRSLHRQVTGPWLEKYHYAAVQRLSCYDGQGDSGILMRDLKASVRAVFFWLDGRFFVLSRGSADSRLLVCFADVVQSVIELMDRRDQQPNNLCLGVWNAVAQWSVRFRKHLANHLGFDRTIVLLNGVLRHILRWSELENLAFELRLVLLGTVLIKCEELSFKRDSVLFSRGWCQYEPMLQSLLAKCNQFMGHYQPPFLLESQSTSDQRKKEAELNLTLKESAFHRLSCEIHKTPLQQIREKMQTYCIARHASWASSLHHREIGTLELAKWYFLVNECAAAARSLMAVQFSHSKLSWKKADLLVRYGAFQAAVDEYHYARTLITDSDGADRDKLDGRLAMAYFFWFEAENNTDHLISAYRLSVDLLGRCSIENRRLFEGGLIRIVNTMKNKKGLRFEDYVGQTSVLGYLVKDGRGIKSWQHFANLLYIRHKMGLTGADAVNKVADEIADKRPFFIGLDKKA